MGGVEVTGWTSTILATLIMGGIQLTALGVLGEYLGRVYMGINLSPQFTIKELKNII